MIWFKTDGTPLDGDGGVSAADATNIIVNLTTKQTITKDVSGSNRQRMNFDNVIKDKRSEWSASTFRFSPLVPSGKTYTYDANVFLSFQDAFWSTGVRIDIGIWLNGPSTILFNRFGWTSSGGAGGATRRDVISFQATIGQYFEFFCLHQNTTDAALQPGAFGSTLGIKKIAEREVIE